MKPGALLLIEFVGHRHRQDGERHEAAAGRRRRALLRAGQRHEAAAKWSRGTKSSPETIAATMKLGRDIGKISAWAGNGDGFVANRSRGAVHRRERAHAGGRRAAGAGRQGADRFRLPDGPVRGQRPRRASTSATTRRKRSAAADPNFRKIPDRRPPGRDGPLGPEDRRRLVSLREGRPHAASRPIVAQSVSRRSRTSSASSSARFTDDEILRRLLFASVNEACKILEERQGAAAPATSTSCGSTASASRAIAAG